MKNRVLFLAAGNLDKASARFRLFQFLPYIEQFHDIIVADVVNVHAKTMPAMIRTLLALTGVLRTYDTVFIQKARLPIIVTVWLARRSKLIYDYDDAIYHPQYGDTGNHFRIKKDRVDCLLRRASIVVAGNKYLAEYAAQYANNIVTIPTVVDTGRSKNRPYTASTYPMMRQVFEPAPRRAIPTPDEPIVVGWIGGPWYLRWLDYVGPSLLSLQRRYNVTVKIVSSRDWQFSGLTVVNKRWKLEDEVRDLQGFDIGLMPLDATNPFVWGKCGFKILEYMATGSVPVASAVGVNTDIIHHGKNGFLIEDNAEWKQYLERLILDRELRMSLAKAGREHVVAHYSVESVLSKYESVFRQVQ